MRPSHCWVFTIFKLKFKDEAVRQNASAQNRRLALRRPAYASLIALSDSILQKLTLARRLICGRFFSINLVQIRV